MRAGLSVSFGLAASRVVSAASLGPGPSEGYVGVLGGISLRTSGDTVLTYEFEAGYRLMPELIVGLYYLGDSTGVNVNEAGVTDSSRLQSFSTGIQLMYPFASGVQLGLRLGWVNFSPSVAVQSGPTAINFSSSYSTLGIIPTAAYDVMVGARVSVGGEFSYTDTLSPKVPKMDTLLAAVKYHF